MGITIKELPAEATWPIRHEVMWPNKEPEYVRLERDAAGTHFGLMENGQLVSVISVFVDDGEAQFRKFATLEGRQGRGHGTRLLQHVMGWLVAAGVSRVWCNARVDKAAFYQRFDMVRTDQTFVKGGLDYVMMERKV